MGRQEEQIAHASNIITPVIARKTARQRLIRTSFTIYEFATDTQQHQLSGKPMYRQERQGALSPVNGQPIHVHGRRVEEIQQPVVTARDESQGAHDAADPKQVLAGTDLGRLGAHPLSATSRGGPAGNQEVAENSVPRDIISVC